MSSKNFDAWKHVLTHPDFTKCSHDNTCIHKHSKMYISQFWDLDTQMGEGVVFALYPNGTKFLNGTLQNAVNIAIAMGAYGKNSL